MLLLWFEKIQQQKVATDYTLEEMQHKDNMKEARESPNNQKWSYGICFCNSQFQTTEDCVKTKNTRSCL